MNEDLDNHIHKLRLQHKISQQELADAIGVSRKTISTVETGRFTPSVVIALKIAEYFAIPVEQVFALK
ncbi:helix-turn-helix transcriptional regulator [Alteromonas macleodii]|jgi:putative transcriptional regulator|uniref:Helix-turn-helix family protein n=1 Tax=Alteromonas macleodii TaxID=28108 RepID=A0AB36FZ54_ALTMA|nr:MULTISPECIES: helix-turn-helix transcriptional regulator [Alteromonas]MAL72246.1 transcriptional regulator [Alteromonas sp.]MCG8497231.1 helix-turn-helix transcriptional regulator [Enterobacterales bacterium]MEC7529023.1 helix-turn-helix transcriptional regulator [Pseudomonadota bacterium]NKX21717.1 helix-turn-helix transcriptional regulator [Alteromonadaceae bacterium A_SAG2]AFS36111.1 XRE family transcriptional regulator [Alteromonas macleodii ATCC 27126]|tara:strand:+ start:1365 stop:1568 length:204 start_codon:yes stop_codon:yes gene_type:complete